MVSWVGGLGAWTDFGCELITAVAESFEESGMGGILSEIVELIRIRL